MKTVIDADNLWLAPLPPDPHANPLTPELRPKTTPMPPIDPTLPIATWAETHFNFTPDPLQTRILNTHTPRLILCCTRQWGKSSIAALKALHLACSKPGALILFAAACFWQSAELLLKFRTYANRLTNSPLRGDGIRDGSLLLPNGARIVALPENPKTVRCYSAVDLIVIDEAAFVTDEMYNALSPMLAVSNGQLWLLSSPSGQSGEFYRVWTDADPTWHRFTATAANCPRISPAFLETERRAKGEAVFNREYMCHFDAGPRQAIALDTVENAFRGNYPAMQFPK